MWEYDAKTLAKDLNALLGYGLGTRLPSGRSPGG
jgi:hypothetical protein